MADARATLTRWHSLFQADASWIPPQHADLVAALRELEPGARDALVLSWLNGLPVAQIAEVLDEAAGTIAYWISSAQRRLQGVTPDPREALVELERAAPATVPAAQRSRGVSPIVWMGVPLTVALVVAIIGVAQLTRRAGIASGVGNNPSAAPTASAQTVTNLAWTEVRFVKDATIQQMTVAGERIVAIGGARRAPGAWYSDDGGETWQTATMKVMPPTEDAVASFQSIAASGEALVAVGAWQTPNVANPKPVWNAWVSTDHGASWHEAAEAHDGFANVVAPIDDGFLVAGGDLGRGSMQLWTSADGESWQSVARAGFQQFGAGVADIARYKDGYIAVGVNVGGSRPRLAMWSSTDGRQWSSIQDAPVEQGMMRALSANADGVVVLGLIFQSADGSDARTMLWHSSDGKSWEPLQLDDQQAQAFAVTSGPLGMVVLGMSGDGPQAWFIPITLDGAVAQKIDGAVQVVVALPDRFVAAGGCADAACTRSRVLIGDPLSGAASSPSDEAP